ncbi:MAG: DMT family transporter [Streptosporangiaceae bacterium]
MPVPYGKTVLTGNDHSQAAPAQAGLPAGRSLAARSPMLLAGLGAACISASAVLVTLAHTGAATTAVYRCALALPLLIGLAIAEQRRRGPRPLAARASAVLAGMFLAVDLVLWNHAIAAVGAGVATVLGNLQVVFVALTAWLLFGERPQRRFVILLPVVMGGVVLVSGLVGGSGIGGSQPLAGIEYGLGTSLAYSGFLIILRRTSATGPHVAAPLAEAITGAAAGSLLLGLAFGGLTLAPGWHAFWWLLVLAISSQTIGWLLITSSLPRLPAAVSSLLLLLQPAAAMLLATVALGQRPSLIQVIGAVVVCSGILAASRTRQVRPAGPVPREGQARAAVPAGHRPPAG